MSSGETIPFAIVVATATPKIKGPTKLAVADNETAWRGVNTLVPITVATEFAESLNPLTKSNTSATPIAKIANSNIKKPRRILKQCLLLHRRHQRICQMQSQ